MMGNPDKKKKRWSLEFRKAKSQYDPTVLKHEPYIKPHPAPGVNVLATCACCGTEIRETGQTLAEADQKLVQRRRFGGGPDLCDRCLEEGVRKYNLEAEKRKRRK